MAPLARVTLAHGGFTGTVVEALLLIGVAGVLIAVWLRERRRGPDDGTREARMRDDRGW